MLLVPDCRKLRQEMIRSTCMDPAGAIRPDYVAYAGVFLFSVVGMRTLRGGGAFTEERSIVSCFQSFLSKEEKRGRLGVVVYRAKLFVFVLRI